MKQFQSIVKIMICVFAVIGILSTLQEFLPPKLSDVSYTQFLQEVKSGEISHVVMEGSILTVTSKNEELNKPYKLRAVENDVGLIGDLLGAGITLEVKPIKRAGFIKTLANAWGPLLLLLGMWIYFMRQIFLQNKTFNLL